MIDTGEGCTGGKDVKQSKMSPNGGSQTLQCAKIESIETESAVDIACYLDKLRI